MSAEHIGQAPGFELPKAPTEHAPSGEKHKEHAEKAAPAPERSPHAPAQAAPSLPTAPVTDQTTPAVSTDDDSTATPSLDSNAPTADLVAEDVDLIEKEWVERAKNIVSETREDPHKQKTEISRAKADYIAKRFNKTLKVDASTDQ